VELAGILQMIRR